MGTSINETSMHVQREEKLRKTGDHEAFREYASLWIRGFFYVEKLGFNSARIRAPVRQQAKQFIMRR